MFALPSPSPAMAAPHSQRTAQAAESFLGQRGGDHVLQNLSVILLFFGIDDGRTSSGITVVITQHEKQTYYKQATCRVFGFITLLSGDLFSGQTNFHRQSALPVSTLASPTKRSNCDRLSGSNQSNYCRKSPPAIIRAWKLYSPDHRSVSSTNYSTFHRERLECPVKQSLTASI